MTTTYFLVMDDTVMFAVTVPLERGARDAALDYFASCMQDEPSGAEVEAMIGDGTYELFRYDNVERILGA